MRDVDRTKNFDSKKQIPSTPPPDPPPDDKELLDLQARLEKATGEERERIEAIIRSIEKRQESPGSTSAEAEGK